MRRVRARPKVSRPIRRKTFSSNIWKELPIKSHSNNPKNPYTVTRINQKTGRRVSKTVFPENKLHHIVVETRGKKLRLSSKKVFDDTYDSREKAEKLFREKQGKDYRVIYDADKKLK